MVKTYLLLVLLSCILCGCNTGKIPDILVDKNADAYATSYIGKLQSDDTAYCLSQLSPQVRNEKADETVKLMAKMMLGHTVKSHRLVNINTTKGIVAGKGNIAVYFMMYEYVFYDTYGYYTIQLRKEESGYLVTELNFNFRDKPLEEEYKFSLANKSFLQYLFLALGFAIIIFKIITIVVAAKTPIRRKGWWIFFIIIGICRFSINWYNSEISFQLLQFDFIGFGANKQGLIAPWMVNVFIPLGAIIFWIRRRSFIKQETIEKEIKETYVDMGSESAYPDKQQ